jgi:hypothetical protein
MNGSDLIVAAPWIIFGIGLLVMCIRLLRSHRSHRSHRSGRSHRPSRCRPENRRTR